jgi:hypothetical protein
MEFDTSFVIEDLVEPTDEHDEAAAREPSTVAEATETWEPPV